MYVPAAFREADLQVLHALIRANNFGTLIAHLTRPNPHWKSFLDADHDTPAGPAAPTAGALGGC